MGDTSEMMQDGVLCQVCGVFIEDSIGVPTTCDDCKKEENISTKDFSDGAREPDPRLCPKCGLATYIEKKGPHVGWYCIKDGWLSWQKQKWKSFIMPFGKYKGDTLGIIAMNNPGYIEWLAENIKNGRVKEAATEALVDL